MKNGNVWRMAVASVAAGLLVLSACRPPDPEYGSPSADSVALAESVEQVRAAQGVTLIDFYADWCPPCRVQGPVIAEVDQRIGGQAQVLKVDVDRQKELADEFRIEVLPTLVVLKDGQEVRRMEGLQRDADDLIELLQKVAQTET